MSIHRELPQAMNGAERLSCRSEQVAEICLRWDVFEQGTHCHCTKTVVEH